MISLMDVAREAERRATANKPGWWEVTVSPEDFRVLCADLVTIRRFDSASISGRITINTSAGPVTVRSE